jgi:hypothetical protein
LSRSFRKNPYVSNVICDSEKEDKQQANRRLRKLNKVRIKNNEEPVDILEVSDNWCFGKDGKHLLSDPDKKAVSK